VVLEKLYDNLDVVVVIFYRNYAKNVGSVFGIRIFAVFIGQYETSISFLDLFSAAILLFIRSTAQPVNSISYNKQKVIRGSTEK
jgi:hypothetical protein